MESGELASGRMRPSEIAKLCNVLCPVRRMFPTRQQITFFFPFRTLRLKADPGFRTLRG